MMMSGEVKTLKFAEDKPKDCKFCYYWGGKKKGCTLGGEEKCYYLIKEQPPVKKTKCTDCPYKKSGPCIGWCTRDLLQKKGDKQGV